MSLLGSPCSAISAPLASLRTAGLAPPRMMVADSCRSSAPSATVTRSWLSSSPHGLCWPCAVAIHLRKSASPDSFSPAPRLPASFRLGRERLFRWWLLPIGSARDGSRRLNAVTWLVPDGGHRLLLAERGPGGERLTEPAVPQRLASLSR